jgi:hypothetical protein
MDLCQFAWALELLVADIVQIDGLLFVNHEGLSLAELRSKIATYDSQKDAQAWLNIVLLDGFITDVVGDEWEDDDPGAAQIVSVISRAWSYQIELKFPGARFSIEKVSDTEYGDFGLRLLGSMV